MQKKVQIKNFKIGWDQPLTLIAGPCVLEDYETTYRIASEMQAITQQVGINFVFKASYDKANRSSSHSYRGPGLMKGLDILDTVKQKLDIAVTSDIHLPDQAEPAADILDIIQIPAFLCRQTDLIAAAAETGKPINVKKGQFMAPWDMAAVVNKIESFTHKDYDIMFTERGASFGYNNLVVDFRSIAIMRQTGRPTIFDASHSAKMPYGTSPTDTANQRILCALLALAAAGAGIDGLFIEVLPHPNGALCDAETSLKIGRLKKLLSTIKDIHAIRNAPPTEGGENGF